MGSSYQDVVLKHCVSIHQVIKMIFLYLIMLLPCVVMPNTIDANIKLSNEEQEIGQFSSEPDTRNKIEREVATHVHDQGSNMVKRLLKNYESYQNVLQEREVEAKKQDDLKNSVFMHQFHNAAGVVKDYGKTGYVRAPEKYVTDVPSAQNISDNVGNKSSGEDSNNTEITNDLVGINTTTEMPGQIDYVLDDTIEVTTSPTIDETQEADVSTNHSNISSQNVISQEPTTNNDGIVNETTDQYPENMQVEDSNQTNEVENTDSNNSEETDSNNSEVTDDDVQESNYDEKPSDAVVNDDNAETDEERDGRIVNKAGARRRLKGGGPIRISSYSGSEERYSSINSDARDFHPRPVFSTSSQSQTIHNHIHNSDDPAIGVQDDKTLPGLHQHQQESLVFRESDEESNTNSQETGGLMGWISNIMG